jgi:hypothetical protein
MSIFRQGTARTCVSVAATLSDSEPVTSATTLSWRSVGGNWCWGVEIKHGKILKIKENHGKSW